MAGDIKAFLAGQVFAVAGASRRREKYGNKVLRTYLQNGKRVIPVHPLETSIEGVDCVKSIADLPAEVSSLSVITPPQVTTEIVRQAIAKNIRNIWLQPGAESPEALADAKKHGINMVAGGPCLLVVLGFHE